MTDSNYRKLQDLQEKYASKSFTILGFPCNQFENQESKSNEAIQDFVHSYNVTFPVFDKINVNGKDEMDLYRFLKNNVRNKSLIGRVTNYNIMWNFTKFLCVDGIPYYRFEPTASFDTIERHIEKHL